MNSIRAISINTLNDDKSHSMSNINNSWKIEKFTDYTGKSNYKIKTEKNKPLKIINYNSMPAYGVPGAKSYQTKNVPTLNKSIMKSSPIRTIRKNRKMTNSPIVHSKSISPELRSNSTSPVNTINNVELNYFLDRNAFKTMDSADINYIINQNNFISYQNERELAEKSFIFGHLFLKNVNIQFINLNIFYPNFNDYLKISLWSQNLNDIFDIQNIYNFIFRKNDIQKSKFISKEVKLNVSADSQIFFTIHFDSVQIKQEFGIKYSLYYSETNSVQPLVEKDLNVLQVIPKKTQITNDSKSSSSSSTKSASKEVPFVLEKPKESLLPNIQQNNTIFGNVQMKTASSKEKNSILNDTSNFSLLPNVSNQKKKEMTPIIEFDDSSNNTENDLKNILEILKELKH